MDFTVHSADKTMNSLRGAKIKNFQVLIDPYSDYIQNQGKYIEYLHKFHSTLLLL